MGTDSKQLDNTIEIITPENIAFRYQVAGPFRRLPAYLIDVLARGMLILIFSLLLMNIFGAIGLAGMGLGLILGVWFLLSWFYGGVFEALWNGQTPGKRLMHVRVVSIDGQPINALQAVLRNVLRTVDEQPAMFCLVGLLTSAMNDRFQRMGDIACGTMVVVEERHWFREVMRINAPEAIRLAGLIPANFQASRTTAQALAAYVQRRNNFPPMRRMEIARHLGEPLRERFNLPVDTDLDMLLCGLYQRTFITDWEEESPNQAGSPFAETQSPIREGSPFAETVSHEGIRSTGVSSG